MLACRTLKEIMPIDVLIAKRRSNVAPSLLDNFHDAPIGAPLIIFSGVLIRKNTVAQTDNYLHARMSFSVKCEEPHGLP